MTECGSRFRGISTGSIKCGASNCEYYSVLKWLAMEPETYRQTGAVAVIHAICLGKYFALYLLRGRTTAFCYSLAECCKLRLLGFRERKDGHTTKSRSVQIKPDRWRRGPIGAPQIERDYSDGAHTFVSGRRRVPVFHALELNTAAISDNSPPVSDRERIN